LSLGPRVGINFAGNACTLLGELFKIFIIPYPAAGAFFAAERCVLILLIAPGHLARPASAEFFTTHAKSRIVKIKQLYKLKIYRCKKVAPLEAFSVKDRLDSQL
jgi:hypothetical protein